MIEFFSLQNIITSIKKQFKVVVFLLVAIPVLTFLLSLLLPNLFKSSVVIYPANNYLNDRNYYYKSNIQNLYSQYGGDDDIDKIIEIGSLKNVLEFISDTLKLPAHYKINEDNVALANFKAGKKLDDRIQFLYTKNNALEVSVWDNSPAMAAKILEILLLKINNYILNLQNQKVANEVVLIDNKIKLIKNQLQLHSSDSAQNSITSKITAEAIASQLSETEKLKMSVLASPNAGRAFYQANDIYTSIKKDKPKRLIITAFSAMAAVVLAILFAIIKQYNKIK
jgi:ABC-type dipeptide/oligopeptide/nickel transport system permease component